LKYYQRVRLQVFIEIFSVFGMKSRRKRYVAHFLKEGPASISFKKKFQNEFADGGKVLLM